MTRVALIRVASAAGELVTTSLVAVIEATPDARLRDAVDALEQLVGVEFAAWEWTLFSYASEVREFGPEALFTNAEILIPGLRDAWNAAPLGVRRAILAPWYLWRPRGH